jgi:hypothetical protein
MVDADDTWLEMSIVTAIWLCRRIVIATRGWTSRATSRDAQVRRVACTGMTGTPAFAARAWKKRCKLRGSIGVPNRVVKTNPDPIHASPAANRERASVTLR